MNDPIILIIDDEEVVRDSCSQALVKLGHRVEVAEDGNVGLKKTEELRPDIVLLDLKMPGISGMEVLEKIVDIDENIVIIVITGYATVSSAVDAMKRGAYDFLPKPFTPDELRIITKRGIERRRLVLKTASLQQEKEKMKRNFITMVSHELRTPLASILQYIEVILGGMTGGVASEQEEILKRMQIRVMGLSNLIRDWLDMAQIEEGKLAHKFGNVELAPILYETVDFMRQQAEIEDVTLNTRFPDDLPLIYGDKEALKQVFINLFGNAIKYNKKGGAVTITAKDGHSDVQVEVADTGIGISEEDLPFVFDEFYRVKANGTEGTGLGLSIAKKIIEAHHGTISVSSELEKGSAFVVSFPKTGDVQSET